jgi:hypothetical protein
LVEARALLSVLGAGYSGVVVDLDDLPSTALGDLAQL